MIECSILRFVQQKLPIYRKRSLKKPYYIKVKSGCVLCTHNLQTLLIDFDKRVSKYQAIQNSEDFPFKSTRKV